MKKKKAKVPRKGVRHWMIDNDLRPADIQRALDHKSHSMVVETLTGVRDHRQVLKWLRDNGCPIDALRLPEDMKEK